MKSPTNIPKKPVNLFDEEKSNFDLMEWTLKIVSYWYLFLIAAIIALGVAMLQNRKWIAQYVSSGTIILKEYGPTYGGSQLLMQGFGVDAGYKNVNNQVIMLSSYDLMCRVADSLPFMHVDYITQGRFRTRNIYRATPVLVRAERIVPWAYGALFQLDIHEDGVLEVSLKDDDSGYHVETRYGEPFTSALFDGMIVPTDNMVGSGRMYFRFRDRASIVDEFSSRLSLNFVSEGSSVLQISLVSETPQRDCDFIDMLCKCFLEDNLNRKNDVADNSIRFINEQLAILQQSLVVSEGAMTDFRQENKFVDVSSYAGTLMAKLESYDAQEMSLHLKETYLNYLENYIHTNMEEGGVAAPSSLGLNEPMLMALVQQLNDLRIQRAELSEKNVYYAKYTKDIENVKEAINEVVSSMRASLEIEKKDLQARYAQVRKDVKNLPEKELQMIAIERNYRIDDNYYTFFLQKRAEAEIQKASNMPDNDILDKARTLSVTNASQKRRTIIRNLIIGLLIPLLLIILSELLNNKVRTPKEVESLSDFRLIGTIRHARNENPTLVKSKPRSSYAEMLRSLRSRIEFIVQRKTGITVTITSTQSGDGKTFLSTNLAALYAMGGKPTLLIDMDIRKPNVHEKLGLDVGRGVTNYLIGECTLEDIIEHHEAFDFDIMRAGTIPPNPGELIRSEKLTEMLKELRKRYEFIVIDSSPIGQVPDAYVLVEQTDITLFVLRCMQTNRHFAKSTLEQLAIDHADKIKLVLSDIPAESHGLRYGGRYGYGYNYGYGYGYAYGYGYGSHYGYGRKKKNAYNYYSDDEE